MQVVRPHPDPSIASFLGRAHCIGPFPLGPGIGDAAGFFTVRTVEAATEAEAGERAVAALESEHKFQVLASTGPLPPVTLVESISSASDLYTGADRPLGYALYSGSEQVDLPGRYRHLNQFLGGSFHEDWRLEDPSWQQAITRYLREEPTGFVAKAIDELETVLRQCPSDTSLRSLLDRLGCCFWPGASPGATRAWQKDVLEALRDGPDAV